MEENKNKSVSDLNIKSLKSSEITSTRNLIELNVNKIEFPILPITTYPIKEKQQIKIKNISNENLFIQLQSSKTEFYRVTPPFLVLTINNVGEINITFVSNKGILQEEELNNHKFKIVAKIIPDELYSEMNNPKGIKEKLSSGEIKKPKHQTMKIDVKFISRKTNIKENKIKSLTEQERKEKEDLEKYMNELNELLLELKDLNNYYETLKNKNGSNSHGTGIQMNNDLISKFETNKNKEENVSFIPFFVLVLSCLYSILIGYFLTKPSK